MNPQKLLKAIVYFTVPVGIGIGIMKATSGYSDQTSVELRKVSVADHFDSLKLEHSNKGIQ